MIELIPVIGVSIFTAWLIGYAMGSKDLKLLEKKK